MILGLRLELFPRSIYMAVRYCLQQQVHHTHWGGEATEESPLTGGKVWNNFQTTAGAAAKKKSEN